MTRLFRLIAPLLLGVPLPALAALQVVTTTEGLAAIAREVGGDRVQVTSAEARCSGPPSSAGARSYRAP